MRRLEWVWWVVLFLVLASTCSIVRAYEIHQDGKFDRMCITYDDPAVGAALREWAAVSAIEDCGLAEVADIRLEVVAPWPWYGIANAGRVGANGITAWCVIKTPPQYAAHHGVLVHEVGHCLGMGHSEYEDAAMYLWCCAPLSDDDIAGIRALYGPAVARQVTYRLFVPGVAR